MGLLQLGFVTIFLSHAVVSGFTSGAAIVIGLSQVKYLFGYSIPNDKEVQKVLKRLFEKIDEFNWKTFLLGTTCVGVLWGIKQLGAKFPKFKWTRAIGPLLVTTAGIILQATIDLEARGIPIVGHIPSGLPHFKANVVFPLVDLGNLWFVVFSIVIIGFMESIAIAKQLASKHHYELDSSLELVGLGMANISSGLFGGYPVVGSFSRSAVNNDSGAKSQISGMVTATLVAMVLLFMTPVFELMVRTGIKRIRRGQCDVMNDPVVQLTSPPILRVQPMAVLASIVISGVTSLVDYPEAMYLWKVHKLDFTVWMLAFLGTLFLGAELGLSISVCISLLLVIFESAYPGTSVLGRLPGTQTYRSIKQYPQAERYDGIVMVRVDAPIYFANQQTVREKLKKYYDRPVSNQDGSSTGTPIVHYVLLEMSAVSHVDTSALHMLSEFHSNYQKLTTPCQLCLVNPNPGVMSRLVASGVVEDVGKKHIFVSLHDAVEHCLYEMDQSELGKLEATIEATSTIGSVVPDDPLPSVSEQPVGEHDVEDPPTKCHSA
jgi:sulfate transporter 4